MPQGLGSTPAAARQGALRCKSTLRPQARHRQAGVPGGARHEHGVAVAPQVWASKFQGAAATRTGGDSAGFAADRTRRPGVCDSCLAGKQWRLAFPIEAKYRATHKLELVHGDLCGLVTPTTPSGNKLFFLLVDDLSRYMWLILLSTKEQAITRAPRLRPGGSSAHWALIAATSSRRAPSSSTARKREYSTTTPHPTRPSKMGEAVTTAVFILNRSPTQSVDGKTPYEVWHGIKPPVHFLRTFGCVAHVKGGSKHLTKLEDRSTPMVFVGYEVGTKAWRFYNPVTRRVHVSGDAVFEENRPWDWGDDKGAGPGDDDEPFCVEFVTAGGTRHQAGVAPDTPLATPVPPLPAATPSSPATPTCGPEPRTPVTPPAPMASSRVQFVTPPTGELDLDQDHEDDVPLRFRTMDDLIGLGPAQGLASSVLTQELLVAIGDEPASVEEAKASKEWHMAMLEEMGSIEENKTWSLVDLPRRHRAIGLKWVCKLKRDEHGEIVKHKARLIAKGYVQRQGVDFEEVFAPVARMESVRVALAMAAHCGWPVHHMDVKSAFLNGELMEEGYVEQPPGFTAVRHEGKVLRLHKALYGLRRAPRAWNAKLDASLHELSFTKSKCEHGLYMRGTAASRLLVGVYVDDLLITGEQPTEIEAFKVEMKKLFKMSDLGPLSYYLGIEVKQGRRGIELRQSAYAIKLLDKASMGRCNAPKLSKNGTSPAVDVTLYRSLIGSLRYLLHTRPELSFAIGYLSRFMEEPRMEHMAAMKQVLRYIKGTADYGLFYTNGGNKLDLVGYSDSDMAGDIDGRKSTTGVIFFLGGNPVSWLSQKQRVVALSSCEAEFIAGAAAACQAVWLRRLLEDITGAKVPAPMLKMDNQSAITLSKNLVLHDRSKHIDTKFHFIRECAEKGDIDIEFAGTQEQLADILTKSLGKKAFQELRGRIGVIKLN
ncbi:hypothetical protein U9M48_030091 [Paspalum notatum var. saurae]|uniref:Uncharacterized protein n=1 Tax=Paspalum notatum var. saurae TaxID=547442 RepID=A0AAQ3U0B0_PASNO